MISAPATELVVNGVPPDVLYVDGHPPPESIPDEITSLAGSDRVELVLEDGHGGSRAVDLRFYDQVPTDDVEMVAVVGCTNIAADKFERPMFELPRNTVEGPVELVECIDTPTGGTRIVVDISSLAGRRMWVVVPVIWWPLTEHGEFATASWLFTIGD